jgi:hypothetical protein
VRRHTNAIIVCLALIVGTVHGQTKTSSVDSPRSIGRILGISPAASGKCGTSDLMMAYLGWGTLGADTKARIQKVLSRPARQKIRFSGSGKFRIHYDTTGIDSPSLLTETANPTKIPNTVEKYIDSVAAIFDNAWNLEVGTLGFLPPPSDGTQGGGPEYDVYVSELGSSVFGQTLWSDPIDAIATGTRKTFSTYIEIDNDFLGMRTPGMNGLRITAAHEFHHAIQIGSYGYWSNIATSDFYFYELTSVWMEHIAYNSIRDYYYDLPNYLQRFRDSQNRPLSFATYNSEYLGYERSIWAQYLAKRFGNDIMRQVWTGMLIEPVLASTGKVLQRFGTSLETEFAQFSYWNFFTGDRAQSTKYFDDAADWPRFQPNVAATFAGMTSSITSAGWPLSTQFCQFAIPSDTLTTILVNIDAAGAVDQSAGASGFQLQLSSSNGTPPYQKVAGGLSLSFVPADATKWRTFYLLSSTKSVALSASDPYPNPVRVSQDSKLSLTIAGATEKRATVYFLNAALELVLSREYDVTEVFGMKSLVIPSADLRDGLPSGVYFVKATCGDKEYQWKVAVIR